MRNLGAILLLVALVLSGCVSTSGDRPLTGGTTAPVPWDGPDEQAVFSSDNAHCGKTETAYRRGLPGYVRVNSGDFAGIYHSTDRVVSVAPEMVDTGFTHGNLVLLRPQEPNREVYVGITRKGSRPAVAVAFELGGCE